MVFYLKEYLIQPTFLQPYKIKNWIYRKLFMYFF